MSEWNVYKVFSNGKRAKSPYMTFKSDSADHFDRAIFPSMAKKLQKYKWIVLNVDEPQGRAEAYLSDEQIKLQKQAVVLNKIAAKRHPSVYNKNVSGCLLLSASTDWKWAWCVVDGATNNFVGLLSDKFDKASDAEKWMADQI
jgi:hypothetical protein